MSGWDMCCRKMNGMDDKERAYIAPGLIRDKVAERLTAMNPSVRAGPISGPELRDQIGRTLLKEAHGLYQEWKPEDSEGILRKSADVLEIILAGQTERW